MDVFSKGLWWMMTSFPEWWKWHVKYPSIDRWDWLIGIIDRKSDWDTKGSRRREVKQRFKLKRHISQRG